MAATTLQLIALSNDSAFRTRVVALAMTVAETIYAETSNTTNHAIRVNFAKEVMRGGGANIPSVIAFRPNLVVGNVSYDFTLGRVITDVTDGAISSQITSDWDMLAGV